MALPFTAILQLCAICLLVYESSLSEVRFFISSLSSCCLSKNKKLYPQSIAAVCNLEKYPFVLFACLFVEIFGLNLGYLYQVYQQSIAAVCNLDWPKSKLLVQVLDDSDDPVTQVLIKEEVHKWQQDGANIIYRHRIIREGYKAGNLKSAMNCSYVKDYEFVTIFDADFQPGPDFLKRTVPHFKVLKLFLCCFVLETRIVTALPCNTSMLKHKATSTETCGLGKKNTLILI